MRSFAAVHAEPVRVKVKPLGRCEWTPRLNVYCPAGMSVVCSACGDLTLENGHLLSFFVSANLRARLHLRSVHR